MVDAGVINGLTGLAVVEPESGVEIVGFRTGFVVVGFEGFVVGSVVIGVVISFSVVEIDSKAVNFPTLWYGILFCTSASFSVAIDAGTANRTIQVNCTYNCGTVIKTSSFEANEFFFNRDKVYDQNILC